MVRERAVLAPGTILTGGTVVLDLVRDRTYRREEDRPLEIPAGVEVLGRGGACVVSPTGHVIAGPLYDVEDIVYADCDLSAALRAKRYFDAAGHYGRADVLAPREV